MGGSHVNSAQLPAGVRSLVPFVERKAGSERCGELPKHTQRVAEASGSKAHVPQVCRPQTKAALERAESGWLTRHTRVSVRQAEVQAG